MDSNKRRGRRRSMTGLTVAAVLLIGACSSDDSEFADPEPTEETVEQSASAETATTVADEAPGLPQAGDGTTPGGDGEGMDETELAEFLARRYEAYWEAFDAARTAPTPNPDQDFPSIRNYTAGEQLEVSYQALRALSESGEAIREPETPAIEGVDASTEHRVRVDLIDGTVAQISGCVVNDDVRYIVDSGDVVRDSVSTVLSESTMALTDGEWKVIRSNATDITEGVSGCWLTDDSEFPY